jgi:hypothetical protein
VRHVIGVLFAIAAFLLVMMCMPETGAIYTHDSQSYEYAANTLIKSGQLKYFGYDTPIIQWPPFYILVIAVTQLFDVPFVQAASWINAITFSYLLYACAIFLFDSLSVNWLAVSALVMLTISVPLIHVTGYAWTEMLFTFLSVLSMIFIVQFIKRQKQGWLIAACVTSCLCWLTRYIGIVIICVLSLALLIYLKPFLRKIKLTFVYAVFSCIPMSLWVLRNYLISETLTGGRQAGDYTLMDNISRTLWVFGNWASFITPLFTYTAVVFLVALIAITFLLEKNKNRESEKPVALVVSVLYTVLYAAVLLASATGTAMDPIDSRLWTPVYPFWVFTIVFFMDFLIRNIKKERLKSWAAAGVMVFALTASVSPAFWIVSEGFARKYVHAGTKEDIRIKRSPVVALVTETITPSDDTLIISNEADLLAMHTSLKCYYPPKKNSIPLYSFTRYYENMDNNFDNIYMVWAWPVDSEIFMNVIDFRRYFKMDIIAQNNYCAIYRVK